MASYSGRGEAIRYALMRQTPSRSRPEITARQAVAVAVAEAYWRAHAATPVRIATVCRVAGLSERGLRNAFYSVRGMSPKRCLLAERLLNVRRALRTASAAHATVTTVATDHGFYELGRFAAAYRQAFGETPSATLHGDPQDTSLQHATP